MTAGMVVEARELVAWRGGRAVLDHVSLRAVPGELLAVMGPSGSGKTTLLTLLAGLERPDEGAVCLDGSDIASWSPAQRRAFRRERLGIVFQTYGLLALLTAQENVELPRRIARGNVRAAAQAAERWLAYLGLGERRGHRVDELSGGEQQRVALARALAGDPAVLLLDEPTAELDEAGRERVLAVLVDAADHGLTVMLATHDPDVAGACASVVHLLDGRVVEARPVTG